MKSLIEILNESNDEELYHVGLNFIVNSKLHLTEKSAFESCFDAIAIHKLRDSYRKEELEVEPFGWQLKNTPNPGTFEDLMHIMANLDMERKFNKRELYKAFKSTCKVDLAIKTNPNMDGVFVLEASKDGEMICQIITYIRVY